jgi:hypothetical protein
MAWRHEGTEMTVTAEAPAAIAILEDLAARLGAEGWQVRLHAPPDRRPMLHVSNPRVMMLSELVTAGQDSDGQWWYWWSWAERISLTSEPGLAVAVIGRVLASHDERLSGSGPAGGRSLRPRPAGHALSRSG